MKKIVRLTENDIRRMVMDVVNEVKYGGESLHGSGPDAETDWFAATYLRASRGSETKDTNKKEKEGRHLYKNLKNTASAQIDRETKEHDDVDTQSSKRKDKMKKGTEKARRIKKNLDK